MNNPIIATISDRANEFDEGHETSGSDQLVPIAPSTRSEADTKRGGTRSERVARDVFAEAREKYTVSGILSAFGHTVSAKGTARSPFRDDNHPSFSIYDDGKRWTDHATGEGGDVIELVRLLLGTDHRGARDWFIERLGIDHYDFFPYSRPVKVPQSPKVIQWPAELEEGTQPTWEAFARKRGLSLLGVGIMVQAGILRFCNVNGADCYVVTDADQRAAEIRRVDGVPFGSSKAYPLTGVDKRWLPGAAMLRPTKPDASVLVVEGATDLLSAIDLWLWYRKWGGPNLWVPVAVLGASCKAIDPECANLIRGRRVRIVPDADPAGDKMAAHWTDLFRHSGCPVDQVTLPRGTDLTDNLIGFQPNTLFS